MHFASAIRSRLRHRPGFVPTGAVRDGDEYVINGSKMFTSLAGYADYMWVATRTDPNVAKHKGISMFLVPRTPGIRVLPMTLLGDQQQRRLRGRAGAGHMRVGRREPGLEPHRQPAEP